MESDLLVGQLSINGSISVGAALNIGLVTSVKVHFKNTASVNLAPGALSGNFGGVNNVLQDGVLDGSEGAGTGAQSLGLLGTGVTLSEDVTLGNNDDVTSGELLLQLTHKTGLDLLEWLLELVGHINDDGLASSTAVNLLSGSDVKIAKRRLQFGGGHLKVEKLLGNLGLELIGFLSHKNKPKTNKQKTP